MRELTLTGKGLPTGHTVSFGGKIAEVETYEVSQDEDPDERFALGGK